jgi:hypothetical protein
MTDYQSVFRESTETNAEAVACTDQFDTHDFILMRGRRILRLLCNSHNVICLGLLIYTLDVAVGLALSCYGLTIGMVLLAVRTTHDRNMQFAHCDRLRQG